MESETINLVSEFYDYENKTNKTLQHLGFFLLPSKHDETKIPLQILQDKIIKTINNFQYTGYLKKIVDWCLCDFQTELCIICLV